MAAAAHAGLLKQLLLGQASGPELGFARLKMVSPQRC